uniref:Uncharacterized protein n=1 Tax=Pseudomonas phage Touem01 TaxID=3138548 RepID=A0AAU6W1I2_9VIRU
MTPEQKALAADLEARTAEFIRAGGTITKLSWAGVPIHLDPDLQPNEIKAYSAYGRNYPAKADGDAPPQPAHVVQFERKWVPPALPVQAAPAQSVGDLCKYFEVPTHALAENIADLRVQKVAALVDQLRQIRREARYWISVVNRLEAA